jgi:phosphatidylserine/phosphatidylglycerophosphate/cardiolipin synthase-like enzyme
MYGYDDDQLDSIIREKLAKAHVFVQMSLDKSQAGGQHEKTLLANWSNTEFGNSIAVGTSSTHHAISHLKVLIVDGVYTVTGSTNWSISGESEQDNQLTLNRNAVLAAEMRTQLDLNHDWMLKQMAEARIKAPG